MITDHRYILEPYKGMNTRHKCPSCMNRNKTFSRYIDTETGLHLAHSAGRCERVDKCGYHKTPAEHFKDNGPDPINARYRTAKREQLRVKPSFIDPKIFKRSLCGYQSNHLVSFLLTLFEPKTVEALISTYYIGTSNHWPGSTVFWQIDRKGAIRTGKIMLYNALTGKRVKEPYNHISWTHKALNLENFNLSQCLFGEHLLKNNKKPAAVVESEKTAIIASVHFPQFNWLACGSLQNLNPDRCGALTDRPTILFPDLNAYAKWKIKGQEMGFKVSSVLEAVATDKERLEGLDLVDFLLRNTASNLTIP